MQISKTRNGSLEVQTKTSPAMLRSKLLTKVAGSESNSSSSMNPSKLPTDRSPKIECRTYKTTETEKRRPSRVSGLEFQITHLQDELKKTRDQLNSTESWKRQAQREAEEAKKQLLLMSVKLQDSQSQMVELSAAEEARIQELRKISQERDRAWQSELEAIQNQHSIDSAALASTMNEIRRLKLQLEMVLRSEAALAKKSEADHLEKQSSRKDLAEASFAIENLKVHLRSSEKAEAEAKSMLTETRKQLEVAQSTIESLLTDGSKLMESFSILATELKESRSRVKSLEEIVKSLQEEQFIAHIQALVEFGNLKKIGFDSLDSEVEQLRSALEDALIKYQQEQIESMVKIQCTYEVMEKMSTESERRESVLELRLTDTKSEITMLNANLSDTEVELQRVSDMNKTLLAEIAKARENQIESELELRLKDTKSEIYVLKAKLFDREVELQRVSDMNKKLLAEISKGQENQIESELELRLNDAKSEISLLQANLFDREVELQRVSGMNKKLLAEMESELDLRPTQSNADVTDSKSKLTEKEKALQKLSEENEQLKIELRRIETENHRSYEAAMAEMKSAKAAEKEALTKLGFISEETAKDNQRAATVAEELNAAQVEKTEMEAELRKLKVQAEQWKKAAETAIVMLTADNNGWLVEKAGSQDAEYKSATGKLMGLNLSDDLDDEFTRKKKNFVLRRIRGMWNKDWK